ncbi:MAG TPA: DUF952 domain-containing protein [Novosphingobium capsulatum]|jgi:uncharacterized protein (DUF952 family)|nr:DUF952 domain-containing protein [Novosphingobium aromaticivorans]HIQ18575.1 DUF952 domain-containing protein [Novosphingobium capsulatum]
MSAAIPAETLAYKVLTGEQRAELESGTFGGAPVDLADGYIHMSTADQVTATVDKHFAGQGDLHVATVDLTAFGPSLKWEVSRGGALFPHLYAPLPLAAVVAMEPLSRLPDGSVALPQPE